MENLFGQMIGGVVSSVMIPVKKQVGYLISCTKYVRDLGNKMKLLDAMCVDVEAHMNRNRINNLRIPSHVTGWLEQVRNIKAQVENIPSDVGSCFNIRIRHNLGRKAFKLIEEIQRLTHENSQIMWSDHSIPLGEVDSINAFTSTESSGHNEFESREQTFTKALKALEQDQNSRMIALCGMGGVGKSTMMENLKKATERKKLFDMIVKVVIGENMNTSKVQTDVALYLGIKLEKDGNESSSESARADQLQNAFKAYSDGGAKKILVILDDLWQVIDLNIIGLSPLPNHGIGVKFLLTSRDQGVCSMMGVEANSIFKVELLTNTESQSLFRQFVETLDDDIEHIGTNIVTKCCGLPIAIKTMACTLRNKSKDAWKDALSRLQHHDLNKVVNKIFRMSYNNLEDEETRSILLLCGLFPEDFDIPIEDLVRYGWGLELFNKVYTIREARQRLNTHIEQLMNTNLLIESDHLGCVKMHDLVLAFALDMFSKSSIVNHGNISQWSEKENKESMTRISLSCTALSEFPRDFRYPNLALLKLMNGYNSLSLPEDCFGEIEKLQVVAYGRMNHPSLFRSLQCSTNLRTLCLHECSVRFDWCSIRTLLNLEVLSLRDCGIIRLPYTVGYLKKLKLLDLINCADELQIDNGVLGNLITLEELYIRGSRSNSSRYNRLVKFNYTDDNCNELAICLKHFSTLEIEFWKENTQLKGMSFHKLERFKISLRGHLSDSLISFKNTLLLRTSVGELLDCRMNELFDKTEVLNLEVDGMSHLEDIEVKSLHSLKHNSFRNVVVLNINSCKELRYLFTLGVATALSKLEHLQINDCPIMGSLIHTENKETGTIEFPKLKFLSFKELPNLASVSNSANAIELPQLETLELKDLPNFTSIYHPETMIPTSSTQSNTSAVRALFNKNVVIPKLENLEIGFMKDLKEIWSFGSSNHCNFSMLRNIKVRGCNRLANLFPINPMSLLLRLTKLEVEDCGSIEVLFNFDFESVSEIELGGSSSLINIKVNGLNNLREVWRMKGVNNSNLLMHGFQATERLVIRNCKRFGNVFTPTTAKFDMGALAYICLDGIGDSEEISRHNELTMGCLNQDQNMCEAETLKVDDFIPNVAFTSNLIHTFHHLDYIELNKHKEVEVVFEIESGCMTTTSNNQQRSLLPNLKHLKLEWMEKMGHVWKCKWNELLIPCQQPTLLFNNLTIISLYSCNIIKYLFSPLLAKFLSNLKEVMIRCCHGIEEVVSSKNDQHEDKEMAKSLNVHTNTVFPLLDTLKLDYLNSLWQIGDDVITTTSITDEFLLSQIAGGLWPLCGYSRNIRIMNCNALSSLIPVRCPMEYLKTLCIDECGLLTHIFTFSTLESLKQLEELSIKNCTNIQVIVKEEADGEHASTSEVAVFPCLKSLTLINLPNLIGFFVGKNIDFEWPLLDEAVIKGCPKLTRFTYGHSTSPLLKFIDTEFGKYSLQRGLNFHVTTGLQKTPYPSLDNSRSLPILEKILFSYSDLINICLDKEVELEACIPSNELRQLQKLEKIKLSDCPKIKEIFEVNNGLVELQHVMKFLNLREVEMNCMPSIRYIWKTNQWTVFKFPYLTRVSIDECHELEHVFIYSMVSSLLQLQKLHIGSCKNMEVIVKEEENEGNTEALEVNKSLKQLQCIEKFPVREIELHNVPAVGYIWKTSSWTVLKFPNLTKLSIYRCEELKHVFTCSMVGSLLQLQTLQIRYCKNMEVIVKEEENEGNTEALEVYKCSKQLQHIEKFPVRYIVLYDVPVVGLWKTNLLTVLEFPNLTKLSIYRCQELKHVFSCSIVGSLLQLQELLIRNCKNMEVVVKEEENEAKTRENHVVEFRCLQSLKLEYLGSLKGFCLGSEAFQWPLLHTLTIENCPEIKIFTTGVSTTPNLNEIKTSFGLCDVMEEEDPNSFIKRKIQEGFNF